MPPFLPSKHFVKNRLSILVAAALVLAGAAGCVEMNGRDPVDKFEAASDEEARAIDILRAYIATSESLLRRPDLKDPRRAELAAAVAASRRALEGFVALRQQGTWRDKSYTYISGAALAITLDDVTGFGVGNDALLIPLGLALAATAIFTHPPATRDALSDSWQRVGDTLVKLGDEVEEARKTIDFIPAPVSPEEQRKQCRAVPVCPHRGGDLIHNACADCAPPNKHQGCDVFVNGYHFDAIDRAERVLWEVKTDNWSNYPDWLKRKVAESHAKAAERERDIAGVCKFDFVFAVVDEGLYRQLQRRLKDINLRHVPECGKNP